MRQAVIVIQAAEDRQFHDYELAYYTAFWSGFFSQPHKKFPDYKKHRPRRTGTKPKVPQDWKAQKSVALMLNAAFGGSVTQRVKISQAS